MKVIIDEGGFDNKKEHEAKYGCTLIVGKRRYFVYGNEDDGRISVMTGGASIMLEPTGTRGIVILQKD